MTVKERSLLSLGEALRPLVGGGQALAAERGLEGESASGSVSPSSRARRSLLLVSRGCAAISSASWPARASTCCAGSTISVTRPIACASCASIVRPVRTRSSARPGADDAREALRAAVDQRDAPAALGAAERGGGGGDAQVAPERELEAAGEAVAGDRGDRRLGGGEAGEAERAAGGVGVERLDRLQVGAGAEGCVARAGEDEHRGVIVG